LPAYLSGWDVALMPFALNESTKFISPTKTPEYLAAGLPVISTPIRDVVRPYGEKNLVEIAETAQEFVEAGEKILQRKTTAEWLKNVDEFLSRMSWNKTFAEMNDLIQKEINEKPKAKERAV
jgi:UDP-galactopyranose mutase